MLKYIAIAIFFCFGLSLGVSPQELIEERSPFRNLRSIVTFSQNREFQFVIVPQLSIEAYIENDKGLRRRAGYSEKEIEKVWRSKLNRDQIKAELASREKYPVTGLYRAGEKEPIQRLEDFPQDLDKIYVSNDGLFVIGVNIQVLSPSIAGNASDEVLRRTDQRAVHVIHFGPDPYICSKSINELVASGDALMRTSEGFYWAQPDFVFDQISQSVMIEKLDASKMTIDLRTCTFRTNSEQVKQISESEKGNSTDSCLAIVLIPLLMFVFR